MIWPIFASTFGLIFLAELPDKTAVATVLMATRGRPWPVFCGVAAAFAVQSAVAVAFGRALALLPERAVHAAAALLFFAFAFQAYRSAQDAAMDSAEAGFAPPPRSFARAAWSAFIVIFIAEWGDITQLATASLEARLNAPLTIFASATLALWSVAALAVVAGQKLRHHVSPQKLAKISAAAFFTVGAYLLIVA